MYVIKGTIVYRPNEYIYTDKITNELCIVNNIKSADKFTSYDEANNYLINKGLLHKGWEIIKVR